MAVGEPLEDRSEAVERRGPEQRVGAAGLQRTDADLQMAGSDAHADAEQARARGAIGVGDQCVGQQLRVGDAIGGEVSAGGERREHAGHHAAGDRRRPDRHQHHVAGGAVVDRLERCAILSLRLLQRFR